MPKETTKTEKKPQCIGGRSYNRQRYAHDKGTEIVCMRCGSLMGCVWCCESVAELICLSCHNWARPEGVKRHGDVEPSEKHPRVRTAKGWREWHKETPDKPVEVLELAKKMSTK